MPRAAPLLSRTHLVEHLARGCKPIADWKIGTEHEKFAYTQDDLRPLPYAGERSIKVLLQGLVRQGWQGVEEAGHLIAVRDAVTGASVTLEPGGQVELSGGLLTTVHQTDQETRTHLEHLKRIATPLGIAFLGSGFQPKWGRSDCPWMPKGRYRIMRAYMPKRGSLGLDMMLRTCTVQTNLDFSCEADMVRKFRVALALQPLATALFATSPFIEGAPSGLLSSRSRVWTDTDPDRCGMIPFVFEDGMGFERYVDWMLDVPMYFVYRDGKYLDASGQSFRDFLAGRLAALPGAFPTLDDWNDHLTTAFPEVRLKQYLEMRGADSGPLSHLSALPAFWTGLLYDGGALDAAWDLTKDWTLEQRESLRADAPRFGLQSAVGGKSLRDLATEVLDLASRGLKNRAQLDENGNDESLYLEPLHEMVRSGKTRAERMLDNYHGAWGGKVDPVFLDIL